MSERITKDEAYRMARTYERTAQRLRAESDMKLARAETMERWAAKWRNWADDDHGEVPYPGKAK
jgi:hypothetical protein